MKPSIPRFAPLRAGLAAVFAFAGLLIACQSTLPSEEQIDRMNVATRTAEMAKATQADTTSTDTVESAKATIVDSTVVALDRARVITPPPSEPTRVDILIRIPAPAPEADVIREPFVPLIFIDGVRATMSEMNALDRERIESVEVLKGRHAEWYYGDPEAAKGVITITTKRGGSAK
jgi:outer membrane receptor protein involved in Fe transport